MQRKREGEEDTNVFVTIRKTKKNNPYAHRIEGVSAAAWDRII